MVVQPLTISNSAGLYALIASAHTDHTLRVWDARLQQAACKLQLAHPGWVAAVRWCPHSPHLLASACYDGRVRLWGGVGYACGSALAGALADACGSNGVIFALSPAVCACMLTFDAATAAFHAARVSCKL